MQGLAAEGKPPPTATRVATGAKTGKRTGTKGGGLTDMKDALTETLVKKMREKFASEDIAVQDIIGEEVVTFMTTTGSVKEEDIEKLEGRIRDRITGQQYAGRRYKGPVYDEWANITKWEAEEAAKKQLEIRQQMKVRQQIMKKELDAQVAEKEAKKQAEKQAVLRYAEEEQAALDAWKNEEMAKLARRAEEMEKLKSERAAQLSDQARRRADQAAAKHKEEEEAKKLLAMEHKRKLKDEADQKAKMQEEMAKLVEMNNLALKMAEEKKQADAAEELMYQKQYADKLKKQEEAYIANLNAMKEKQKLQEMKGAAIGEYKRWIDPKIIERNFAEREAALDKAEEDAIQKVHDGNMEMRRVIAEQVKEKKERLAKEKATEDSRYFKFTKVLNSLDTMEKAQMMEEKHRALKHKAELEAQMRDNLVRKQVFPMTATERALNADLIKKVDATKK